MISIGALAGLRTVVVVLVLGQTRVLFAMSRDRLMPRSLTKTGPHGTTGADHLDRRCPGRGDGIGLPDRQARGDGQHRHAVRVRAGVGVSYVSMPPEADHHVADDLARLMTPFAERCGVIEKSCAANTC